MLCTLAMTGAGGPRVWSRCFLSSQCCRWWFGARPEEDWDGVKVVTSGIIADNPGLLDVFDEYEVCIVADGSYKN